MSKVVGLDMGGLVHVAIFDWGRRFLMKKEGKIDYLPTSVMICYTMLISMLKKVGIDKEDIIILAQEGKSWRKNYSAEYKENRQKLRESLAHVDWKKHYSAMNKFQEQLAQATNLHVLREPSSEADDILAICSKYYKNKEVVIITGDSDLDQLATRSNVKIFSINKKINGSRGSYKIVKNGYEVLSQKIAKGDKKDNIFVHDPKDEHETAIREYIINLLELPEDIENKIIEKLKAIQFRDYKLDQLPFPNTKVAQRFSQIFDPKYKLDYDKIVKAEEKKEFDALCKNCLEKKHMKDIDFCGICKRRIKYTNIEDANREFRKILK